MGLFQFYGCFVEIDDVVEEREDVGVEVGDVFYGLVVGVEDGEEVVYLVSMDECLCYYGQEFDLCSGY